MNFTSDDVPAGFGKRVAADMYWPIAVAG